MSVSDDVGPVVGGSRPEDDLTRWFGPAVFPATIAELRAEAWAALAPERIARLLASLDGTARVESVTALRDLLGPADLPEGPSPAG